MRTQRTEAQKWADKRRQFMGQLCGMRTVLKNMKKVELVWFEDSRAMLECRIETAMLIDRMVQLIRKRRRFRR